MSSKKQMKRLAAPKKTKILRKEHVWTVKTRAGTHPAKESVPLAVLARDYLKIADTASEARKIIKSKELLVDGRAVTDPKFPAGFMDIITLPKQKKQYRIILDRKGRIDTQELDKQTNEKLCRVEKVAQTKKGKLITLHDGRNIVTKDKIKTGDVIKIEVPSQKINEHYPLKEGSTAYIISGKHAGETGKVQGIIPGNMTRRKQIIFKEETGEFTTPADYIFVLGTGKPAISLGE